MSVEASSDGSVRRFFGRLSIYAISRLVNRGVAFATIPIVAAYIGGVDAYGAKEYLEFLIVMSATLTQGEILQALVRYLSGDVDGEDERKVFWTTAFFLAVSGLLVALPATLLPRTASEWLFGSPDYADAIACAGLIVLFNAFFRLALSVLEARQAARAHAVLSLGKTALEVSLKLILLMAFGLGYLAVFVAVLVGDIVFGAIAFFYVARHRVTWPDIAWLKRLMAFSLPIMATNLCMFGVHQIDRVFLVHFTDLAETGIYGVGWKFGTVVSAVVFAAFGTAWFPAIFAKEDPGERAAFARRTSLLFIAIASVLTLAGMIGSGVAVAMLPADYQAALPVVRIILFAHLFWFLYQVFSIPLFLHMRTPRVFAVSLLGLGVNVALNWFLVPTYGAVGAGLATVLAYLLLALTIDAVARRTEPIAFDRLRLYGLVALTGAIYALWSLGTRLDLNMFVLAVTGLACCAAFAWGAAVIAGVPLRSAWGWRQVAPRRR